MDLDKIEALLQPYARLHSAQLMSTSMYINILLRWNARMNLTAVRNPEEIVTRHFGESFFAAANLLAMGKDFDVVDLGSGAGFPGLPMAIFSPEIRLTLIEANSKKAAFLNEVIGGLQLKNAKVFGGRAEAYQGKAGLVTMRAVERFGRSLPLAVGLAQSGGRIAMMIGVSQVDSSRAIAPEVEWQRPLSIPNSNQRVLMVGIKPVKVG